MLCKSIVAAVVSRNCHDSTGSVAGKHIITDIHRNFLARNRIDGIAAREHSAHLLLNHALTLGLVLNLIDIGIYVCFLLLSNHQIHILALGSKHHESNTKDSVGTSGENLQVDVATCNLEEHLGTFAVANPVALRFLD